LPVMVQQRAPIRGPASSPSGGDDGGSEGGGKGSGGEGGGEGSDEAPQLPFPCALTASSTRTMRAPRHREEVCTMNFMRMAGNRGRLRGRQWQG
jgi:hypothetical protein